MPLNGEQLMEDMLQAALPILRKGGADALTFAKVELKTLAELAVSVEAQLLAGEIDRSQAALPFDMQKQASKTVLLTVQGLGLVSAELALNAALGVIKGVVNAAVRFPLL
jgi:hypothetical protein